MRCTRCDGLVVPQAVGIDADGRVVFGWCLRCLARSKCRLVEISEASPLELKLNFKIGESAGRPRPGGGVSGPGPRSITVDHRPRVISHD